MPGINLTRDEAAKRAKLLSVGSPPVEYAVELDLEASSDTTFPSTTIIRFGCAEPGASTFVDLVDATVHQITLNGRNLDPAEVYVDSRIRLDDLAADNELRVVAECTYSHTGEGLHRFVDPADDRVYLYSQFEVPDARRVFATFEQPDLKGAFTFHVIAPSHWEVASNATTPEPQPIRDGASVWRFETTPPMSTYITGLVAGEYHVVRDSYSGDYGEIPLGLYCRQSLAAHLDTEELLALTRQGFAFFESAFAMAYPFGKYDQIFVPEFNMGAMENAGCVTFRDEYIFRSRQTNAEYETRANTILHEMAHMWFGNLVTMRWWDDLWLNESFAEWASHHAATRATKYTDAWTGFSNARKTWAYRQDQQPTTHPIAADNYDLEAVEVNFDGITYAKGAAALRQLVAWVGEEQFLAGLAAYFRTHAHGNTELIDLLAALEDASGRDLGSWAKEWLQTSGVNTLRARFAVDADERFESFVIEQTAAPDFPTLRRHRIAVGFYDRTDDGLVRRERFETDVSGAETELTEAIGHRQPDLILLNDDDLSYTKIRMDPRSLQTLVEHIDEIDSSLARALCWGAAWDMTRDAEMRARDFVTLVLRGVGQETDLTAVRSLLAQGQVAVDLYSDPAHRASLAARWESGLRDLLEAAAADSDHQLALVRGYAAAARSDTALTWIARLLDGGVGLDGLVIDTDLRWSLVGGLARAGRIDEGFVDAELARDNTISGRELAAAARAAQPSLEAKERAWAAAVTRDDVPNETQRSIALAFQVPGQDEVLEPFVDRYLSEAATLWEAKGVQRASVALVCLFPRAMPRRDVLDRVDAWLSSTQANPAARRLVSEGRADLERALRAQARDAAAS
jgi:aminopeptidase N